jgi:hypothetical protein
MTKVEKFLKELGELSRKHGVWIEVYDAMDIELIDENYETMAIGFYCDDYQSYEVVDDYSI